MSDFQARNVGKTCTYQCDDCGSKAESKPMPPPPALGIFELPDGWELGVAEPRGGAIEKPRIYGSMDDSPVYCAECSVNHELARENTRAMWEGP